MSMVEDGMERGAIGALSDQHLLERISAGDKRAFEALFHRHYDRVYGLLFRLVGNRVEAEDIAQEVFLKLYRRPLGLQRQHNVGGWLYRVATNMGYNHLRGQKRRWKRNRVLVPDRGDEGKDPADSVSQNETKARVRATLVQLKPRQAQLLLLRQMGFSYKELAEILEVAPGSVGTMLSRAAESFRQTFTNQYE
jgi:RNA polymerase sigma-70 factor (ECF subfamily)